MERTSYDYQVSWNIIGEVGWQWKTYREPLVWRPFGEREGIVRKTESTKKVEIWLTEFGAIWWTWCCFYGWDTSVCYYGKWLIYHEKKTFIFGGKYNIYKPYTERAVSYFYTQALKHVIHHFWQPKVFLWVCFNKLGFFIATCLWTVWPSGFTSSLLPSLLILSSSYFSCYITG